ncbi:MAG: hypothetical protein OES38_11885, partial [Gammaproteobacteria bacterium]|nr:hypothetical protein [Gammaproteobacteria bacterium]
MTAAVIGGGANNTVRSGSVVILSGKDSDGQDSPVLRTEWAANDPGVRLEERTANSVAFEAPNVAQPADFSFTVTVFDAEDQSDSDTITLTVIPAQDLDKFLTVDGTGVGDLTLTTPATDLQKFTVVADPVGANPVAPGDTFAVTVDATLNYADRNASCASTAVSNPNVCLGWSNNATLQLSGAGYPLTVANVAWNSDNNGDAIDTAVELDIPSIDVSLFNQLIIDAFPPGADESARVALLDPWRTDTAEITLTITLISPIAATAMVGGPGSSTIPLGPADDVTVSQILADGLGSLPIETRETADAYYAAIDPNDEFLTLTDWLVSRGFATRDPDGSANLLQAASDGSGEFAHALYTNNFDLGFGRDMFTRVEEATGNVYAFVTNYPTLQNALEGREEFVTVVMEFSPPAGLPNDDKFTKFLVYAIDEETGEQIRVRSIDFDGRGLKVVPGVCTTCHGGAVPTKDAALAATGYPNAGDLGAMFFPWDLESFLYSDTDPAIPTSSNLDDVRTLDDIDPQRQFTRSAQEDQFRKLNQAALTTYVQSQANEVVVAPDPSRFAANCELLNIWYPGAAPPLTTCNTGALAGAFTDGAVPSGWSTEPQLYTDVHARHCRACHNQLTNTDIQFTTSEQFLDNPSTGDMVFRTGVMPLARVTTDRLWAGTDTSDPPIDILRGALPSIGTEIPGGPVAQSDFAAQNVGSIPEASAGANSLLTKTGRTVDMTGEESLFFDSLTWNLAATSSDPNFATCLQDPPALVSDGADASLTPSIAADYCVELSASRTDFTDNTAPPLLVRAVDDRLTSVLGSTCSTPFDGANCISVDEVSTVLGNPTEPQVVLRADLAQILDPTRLFALFDMDIEDGLDADTDFRVDFDTSPPFGPSAGSSFVVTDGMGGFDLTTRTSFFLDELVDGEVAYQSGFLDVVVEPTIDTLRFDVIYTGEATDRLVLADVDAEVLILAKSDSAPTLEILNAAGTVPLAMTVQVDFGATLSGRFRVTDPDAADVILTMPPFSSTISPDLSSTFDVNAPDSLGSASGDFDYTANDAETL